MLWQDLDRFGRLLDPWRELERFNRAFPRGAQQGTGEFPAFNVWTKNDHAVVTTELPGINPEAIEISVVGTTLTVRGERKPEGPKEGESYHRRERWQGKLSKTIELPFPIESDKVVARFTKGLLSIALPRAESDKPRKITIKSE